MTNPLAPQAFFELQGFACADIFEGSAYVWEVLARIGSYLRERIEGRGHEIHGCVLPGAHLAAGDILIGPGTVVEPGAYIAGPTIIGANCEIRQGAYIRGNVILGDGTVVGHATEVKNSILLPEAAAPHFNYVGDSILGRHVNLGAGTKLSNLTVVSVKDPVTGRRPTLKVAVDGVTYDTGLAKLGAILGDHVQTGCNSVLNPGVLIGPRTLVYANASLPKGYYPADSIIKLRQTFETVERRS
ncbi:MAG: glucose-1-phosphate thymidylyltransferase [Chloroflexi bacterium]|nr:MAG: glucose-1-phosphate thymidylyltransferase [Chloroflexota bacterium]